MKILLSAVGGMPSVSIIQFLKSKGYYVIGIDSSSEAIGKYFCNEFYVSPFVVNKIEYIEFIKRLDFDIFFPWLDEEHILFANNKIPDDLSSKIVTSPKESILIATSKIKTFLFAKKNNINVAPLTNTTPAFIRKDFSRGSKNAYIEENIYNLTTKLNDDNFLVQEVLTGEEYTIDILTSQDYFFAVPRKRISSTNVSLIGEIDMNSEIISFAKKIVSKLDFFGPINIQIIRSNIDNKLFLIEINPRLAGTVILSIKGGFNILEETIKLIKKQEIKGFTVKDKLRMSRYLSEVFL